MPSVRNCKTFRRRHTPLTRSPQVAIARSARRASPQGSDLSSERDVDDLLDVGSDPSAFPTPFTSFGAARSALYSPSPPPSPSPSPPSSPGPSSSDSDYSAPSTPPRKSHGRKGDNGKIPRPPNCFITFRSHICKAGTIPERLRNRHDYVSRAAGSIWRNMSPEEKAPYERLARQAAAEHKRKYPGYSYSPNQRKSAPVKRKAKEDKAVADERIAAVVRDVAPIKVEEPVIDLHVEDVKSLIEPTAARAPRQSPKTLACIKQSRQSKTKSVTIRSMAPSPMPEQQVVQDAIKIESTAKGASPTPNLPVLFKTDDIDLHIPMYTVDGRMIDRSNDLLPLSLDDSSSITTSSPWRVGFPRDSDYIPSSDESDKFALFFADEISAYSSMHPHNINSFSSSQAYAAEESDNKESVTEAQKIVNDAVFDDMFERYLKVVE